MKAEQLGVAPAALEGLTFGDRFTEYFTNLQFNTLNHNLETEGILDYLGRHGDPAAPFDAYMRVMDGITFPYPHADTVFDLQNPPKRANLIVPFRGIEQRDQFDNLTDLAWAGLHGVNKLKVRPLGERALALTNFSYPDLTTLGRIGTALLIKQYGEPLGRNIRLVQDHTISEIEVSGVVRHLPQELRERITFLKDDLGELAPDLLLNSGRIGLMGIALRLVLGHADLELQHARSHRPSIEKNVTFHLTATRGESGIPISGYTMKGKIKDRARDHWREIKEPFQEKSADKIMELVEEAWSDLRVTKGGLAIISVLGTVALAVRAARRSKRRDNQIKSEAVMLHVMSSWYNSN